MLFKLHSHTKGLQISRLNDSNFTLWEPQCAYDYETDIFYEDEYMYGQLVQLQLSFVWF